MNEHSLLAPAAQCDATRFVDAHIMDKDLNCLMARGCTFENVRFERVDLFGAHLVQSHFVGCTFTTVLFGKADLSNCQFTGCTFVRCDLFRAEMIGMKIESCEFTECNLAHVTFCDSHIIASRFDLCRTHGSFIGENHEESVEWNACLRQAQEPDLGLAR